MGMQSLQNLLRSFVANTPREASKELDSRRTTPGCRAEPARTENYKSFQCAGGWQRKRACMECTLARPEV